MIFIKSTLLYLNSCNFFPQKIWKSIFSHLKLDKILHLLIPNLLVLYLIPDWAIFEANSTILWTSFKIHLISAHLKFHYKLLFHSGSAAIPESKFSSATFSSYPIPLWQCMMRKETYMLFLVRQLFLRPLNMETFPLLYNL